jgi:hypothetical protein
LLLSRPFPPPLFLPVNHRAREEIRKRTNLSQWQDKMIIAVVSRLTPQKGVHLIKHAAYKVGWLLVGFSVNRAVFALCCFAVVPYIALTKRAAYFNLLQRHG